MTKKKTKAADILPQGDILFVRIDSIPKGAVERQAKNGKHVPAHSETGHNHTIDALNVRFFEPTNDPNICYLQIERDEVPVVHERPWDTHAPAMLKRGCYIGIRQVERAPEGWRRVQD